MNEQISSAWVFVSHSSEDFQVVRQVRNYLEDHTASPLLFYLRALTDPEEFWPLIEREINARNFFLYCDSPRAQESEWVRRERATAEGSDRQIVVGRLEVADWPANAAELDRFLGRVNCYLSYLARDRARVAPFAERLRRDQFGIWSDRNPEGSFDEAITSEIATSYAFVGFLSGRALQSEYVKLESRIAAEQATRVFYVLLDPLAEPPPELGTSPLAVIDASDGDVDRAYGELRAQLTALR